MFLYIKGMTPATAYFLKCGTQLYPQPSHTTDTQLLLHIVEEVTYFMPDLPHNTSEIAS